MPLLVGVRIENKLVKNDVLENFDITARVSFFKLQLLKKSIVLLQDVELCGRAVPDVNTHGS